MPPTVFVPGHVTGLFCIERVDGDLLRTGSRGAGLCLTDGVTTTVTPGKGEVRIRFNGKDLDLSPTRWVVERMAPGAGFVIEHRTRFPLGQGFGVSGGCALGAALCLASLGHPGDPHAIAHQAEVACGTGLGDVDAQMAGGMAVRTTAGGPPHGRVVSHPLTARLVTCVVGPKLETRTIIEDPAWSRRINDAGRSLMDGFGEGMTLDAFAAAARAFSERTGLADAGVRAALDACASHGLAFQAMLGRTVVAWGDVTALAEALKPHGPVRLTSVSATGARLIGS